MKEPVDVSVIVPAYNADRTLTRALASIKAQTAAPREVIIVDDRSTDSTVKIAEQFARSYREREAVVIRLPANRGPGSARNRGWERARGEYIAFLDADDAWYQEKLELQCAWMEAHPNIRDGFGGDPPSAVYMRSPAEQGECFAKEPIFDTDGDVTPHAAASLHRR